MHFKLSYLLIQWYMCLLGAHHHFLTLHEKVCFPETFRTDNIRTQNILLGKSPESFNNWVEKFSYIIAIHAKELFT